MKYFVVCPCCGFDLLKADNGSNIEIICPKCNENLYIEVKDDKLVTKKIFLVKTE